jgi:hypothetical protein
MNFLKKIKVIVLSRFKKETEEKWIKERRIICLGCTFNTANMNKISLKQRTIRFFSNLLTLILTGKIEEDNSECSVCGCPLKYKIPEIEEDCDKGKWKSIYITNKQYYENKK